MHIRAHILCADYYINELAPPAPQDLSDMQAMHEVEWSRSEKYSLRDLADPGSTMQYDAAGNSCVTEGVDSF